MMLALVELLGDQGSAVVVVTLEVLVIVATSGTSQFTRTTSEKAAEAPEARDGLLQVTVPPLPTAGVVQVHPPGALTDSNTVFAGTGALTETPDAGSWVISATVMLKAASCPLNITGDAAPLAKATSAPGNCDGSISAR